MVIKSNVTTFSVSIADVSYYDFPASSTGIQENQHALPLISNGHVVFSKLPADSNVNIYTVDGKQLRRYAADRSGNVDIDLTTLPKGVYVISSPITKIKITKHCAWKIPNTVDLDKLDAVIENGLLTITIPAIQKSEEEKPFEFTIRSK